jgi:glycosyltransferase involved in cell wall biosynthesis
MGHSVGLISKGGAFDDLLATYGVDYIRIDQTRRVLTILRAISKLRQTVQTFHPDIIHAHMMTGAVLAFMLRPFMRFKLVTTVHNEFEKAAILMGLGERVFAVSHAVAESMERRGVSKSKLRVVINGPIGSPRLSAELPMAKTLKRPAIVFVGGLHPRKGVADLITAFKTTALKIPNAHLYLIGSGPYLQAYRDLAAQTGVGDQIEFCGQQKDPRSYLLGADLFVLASHAEPAGLVLAEARGSGCAIIATAVGGIPEMLDGGEAGILVPPQRPDLLAEAMIKVLSDGNLLSDLRKRSKHNIEYFTIDRAAKEYLTRYEELLAGSPLSHAMSPPQKKSDNRAIDSIPQ